MKATTGCYLVSHKGVAPWYFLMSRGAYYYTKITRVEILCINIKL